jgi:hypothetical protein
MPIPWCVAKYFIFASRYRRKNLFFPVKKKDVAALDEIHHMFFFSIDRLRHNTAIFIFLRIRFFPNIEAVASVLIKYEYLTSLSKREIN